MNALKKNLKNDENDPFLIQKNKIFQNKQTLSHDEFRKKKRKEFHISI